MPNESMFCNSLEIVERATLFNGTTSTLDTMMQTSIQPKTKISVNKDAK